MRNKISVLVFTYLILMILLLSSLRVFAWGSQDYSDGLISEVQLQKKYLQDVPYSKETEAELSTLTITKALYCNVWHTECDVMGDQYWVKDEISNPQGIKSKEGHRKDHCGAIDSWYVYLDENGKPYSMLEMKAGSTNNLIPLPAHFYTDNTYTELRDPETIEAGERIYWTTENKGQVWHHTGVTRLDIPKFEFVIDGESYFLQPDDSITLEVPAGNHTIIEKYDKEYIINDVNVPFSVDKDENAVISVDVYAEDQVQIIVENRPKNMPEPPAPPETEPATEPITEPVTETETEMETETETETETQTEVSTETEFQSETETETQSETQTETETETELLTQSQTETQTELQSETELQTESETELETETESETESETEKITEKVIESETEPKETEQKQTEPKQPEPKETEPKKVQPKNEKQSETEGKPETNPSPTPYTPNYNNGVLGQSRQKQSEKQSEKQVIRRRIETQIEQVRQINNDSKAPKTGDKTPLIKLICQIVLSFAVIIILAYLIRNKMN